jgi:quercetin dioxygenase-like cupin family protein
MVKSIAAAASPLAIVLAWWLVGATANSHAEEATPVPAAPVVISSEFFASASPVPVDNPELSIARVTIMPRAVIPVHHHPGTQIGVVVQGTLTYTVYTGAVEWRHASDTEGSSSLITAGQTVQIPAGDAVIETPSSIHQGRNDGDTPVVIYLSTLFPAGAPRAIVGSATPTP